MLKKLLIYACLVPVFACGCASPKTGGISKMNIGSEERILRSEAEKKVEAGKLFGRGKYKVVKGDSLWKIAEEFLDSPLLWRDIAEINDIEAPYIIRPGRILEMPVPGETAGGKRKAEKKFKYRTLENNAFGAGEKLVYAVKYFGVTAGHGIIEVEGIEEYRGRQVYKISAVAKTSSFFDNFHRVRDRIESYMDVSGLFSWRYSKKLEEGSYRAFSEIEFDHKTETAVKHTGETYDVPAFVQDVLSELFYVRTLDLNEKDDIYINVCADDGKAYEIWVEKLGYETVKTDAGEFDCIKIRPHLKYEGIFRQKGDVDIWLTNDEHKIPVLVKSAIVIGTIDAVLQEARIVEP
ncbi:MAG: DUF3108 domain-containing protein [Candidatus Goldiibacteriota bacterium]